MRRAEYWPACRGFGIVRGMQAILVAAGMGSRLSPYTDDRPKCMVEVAGRPMVRRALDALRSAGCDRFTVIHGYRGEVLQKALADEPGVTFVQNADFRTNNILLSLMHAEASMDEGFLCSYADILFRPDVAKALAAHRRDFSLVVDPFWAEAYDGRSDHPVPEAELCAVTGPDDRVTRVGKRAVPPEQALGEFTGLWKASAQAARELRALYHRRLSELGLAAPYGRAPRFQVAYLTDLFNDLIDQGVALHALRIAIPRSYREIDTVQDLHRASEVIDW